MAQIFVVDDTRSILQLIALSLKAQGHQVAHAENGMQALAILKTFKPDLIITDVMMPEMDGYELTRRLRADPTTAHIPILTLTAQSALESKIKAFESGADDFMTKPFEPPELYARVNALLRRAASTSIESKTSVANNSESPAHLIAVHSLRGGVGCSTLAVNLAVAFAGLWEDPVLLADFVSTTGQVALMLNVPLKSSWSHVTRITSGDLSVDDVEAAIARHETGLHVLPAPTDPTESAHLNGEHVEMMIRLLRPRYAHIVADVAHDFSDITLKVLEAADTILVVLPPDLASIRAAAAVLDTYTKLEYSSKKIRIVVNWTFQQQGFALKDIEDALGRAVSLVIPFAPLTFVNAINIGEPPLQTKPEDPLSALIEDFAYRTSSDEFRNKQPATPRPGLLRVRKRLAGAARK